MKDIIDPVTKAISEGSGKIIPDLVKTVHDVGQKAGKVIMWNKIIEVAKYFGLLLTIIIIFYFIYKMFNRK